VPAGGVLTLIGETGSGKSLIAHALFGLLPKSFRVSGAIRIGTGPAVEASDTRQLERFWRRELMLVPQEPSLSLDPTMRIRRQMTLAGIAAADVSAALSTVDLAVGVGAAYPFELSGGMAQRTLVATAIGVGAAIVVADEPTKGLDSDRIKQTTALLVQLAREGRTMIVITHERAVAEALGGIIAIVHNGSIVEYGDAARVLSAPLSAPAQAWLAADPATWPKSPCTCDHETVALSAHGLAFAWPGGPLLFEDLDIHLRRGEILAVAGPSGCGKSTLGNILLGLVRPSRGSVGWAGQDIGHPQTIRRLRQRYQKLHQDPIRTFIPGLPLRNQFEALRSVKPDLQLAVSLPPLLEQLKLRTVLLDRAAHEISGGEAQRLALARVLLLEPHVIVADEPTSRLDPVVQQQTMTVLRRVVDELKIGLLLISHDATLTRAVAARALRLGGSLQTASPMQSASGAIGRTADI
jgi:peptide/nickel transport system ATP-binding protein